MTAIQRTTGAAFVLIASLAQTGGLGVGARAEDKPAPSDRDLVARVDQRVRDWQPSKDERRLDDIAWAKDIRDAQRLAKEHGRPIFLFTYSGSAIRENAIALQRC